MFDPGIILLPENVATADTAYLASLSTKRRAFMALPYGPGDAQYIAGHPFRSDTVLLAQESAREHLDLQCQVWCDSWARTSCQRIVQGYPTWVPSYGQPNFNVGPGDSYPGVTPNYDENNPPAGAILVPKIGPDGLFVLPAPYVDPAVPVIAAPTVTAIVGPFQLNAIDVLGDDKLHAWAGVLWGDKSPVNTVDKTGLWIKSYMPSFEPMADGTKMVMWKSIAVAA